jgi:allantoinase
MSMDLVVEGGEVAVDGRWRRLQIGIEEGRIVKLAEGRLEGRRRLDASGAWVLPGMIDSHVHFREPGRTEKEDFASGTEAAALGGVTCVLEIQNNEPLMISVRDLEVKHALVGPKSRVHYGLYANVGLENLAELDRLAPLACAFKVFMTQSVGPLTVTGLGDLWRAFSAVAATGRVLAVHAESDSICRSAREGLPDHVASHTRARPDVAEWVAVAEALALARRTGVRLHLAHLSTAVAVDLVEDARRRGLGLSAATCPHYLIWTEEDVARGGTEFKVNPPIHAATDRARLIEGLRTGILDHVHSDHAPHTPAEKARSYREAPSGIAGIEQQLLVLFELHLGGVLDLPTLLRVIGTGPAAAFDLERRGVIAVGAAADLAILDPALGHEVSRSSLRTRATSSPYIGRRFPVGVRATVVGGRIVVQDGRLTDAPPAGQRVA